MHGKRRQVERLHSRDRLSTALVLSYKCFIIRVSLHVSIIWPLDVCGHVLMKHLVEVRRGMDVFRGDWVRRMNVFLLHSIVAYHMQRYVVVTF